MKRGEEMDLYNQNVKIHVDTSDLDTAIEKAKQLLTLLQKAQKIAVPQGTTQD